MVRWDVSQAGVHRRPAGLDRPHGIQRRTSCVARQVGGRVSRRPAGFPANLRASQITPGCLRLSTLGAASPTRDAGFAPATCNRRARTLPARELPTPECRSHSLTRPVASSVMRVDAEQPPYTLSSWGHFGCGPGKPEPGSRTRHGRRWGPAGSQSPSKGVPGMRR